MDSFSDMLKIAKTAKQRIRQVGEDNNINSIKNKDEIIKARQEKEQEKHKKAVKRGAEKASREGDLGKYDPGIKQVLSLSKKAIRRDQEARNNSSSSINQRQHVQRVAENNRSHNNDKRR